jgi:hypothetical protein
MRSGQEVSFLEGGLMSRLLTRRDVLRGGGALAAAWGVTDLNSLEGRAAEPIRFKIFNYQVETVKEFLT